MKHSFPDPFPSRHSSKKRKKKSLDFCRVNLQKMVEAFGWSAKYVVLLYSLCSWSVSHLVSSYQLLSQSEDILVDS